MKEIALLGSNCHVFAEVLGSLLKSGLSVHAFVDYPEKVMIENSMLTVSHLDPGRAAEDLEGYAEAVLTFNDELTDTATNDFALHHFSQLVTAAYDAGVRRVIVVGSPDSAAFFLGGLRRSDDLDWVFISTEGNFAKRAASEAVSPRHHKEEYLED